jgi:hypothetical protein
LALADELAGLASLNVLILPVPCHSSLHPLSPTRPFRRSFIVSLVGPHPRFWTTLPKTMLPSIGGRNPLLALSVSAGCVLVFIFAFMAWQSPPRMTFPHGQSNLYVLSFRNCWDGSITAQTTIFFPKEANNDSTEQQLARRPTRPLAKSLSYYTRT